MTTPTFCNELFWMTWKASDQVERWKWYLTVAGVFEKSFFHLFLCVMGKAADLSDFDRGQIVMARILGTSISETARLVGCSRSTVVSTYAKWMIDSETSSRRHGFGRSHSIKGKGFRRLSRLVKQNRSQTVTQLTAQYNAVSRRIVSERNVQRTL
ncbi:uncharacterized protein [Parasteatoda tepidariorum]|uniref:uncharacterized protein n=1 Tax=Parasteatoda tepidariorum TaxID=114398 RepID=UPI001C718D69|nr:uncharacterized protein LOC122270489 [Parasteatoda tepidariorum]